MLAWDPSTGLDVVGYRLHYGMRSGDYSHHLDVGNQTTGEASNLVEGTTYYFTVTAYTADGLESEPSEEIHYMPNPPVLLNTSTRAMVDTGDKVMIAGFIIGGIGEKRVALRALGPSLAAGGVHDTLADPVLEVYGENGILAANDSWRQGSAAEVTRVNLSPAFDNEAALLVTLRPGNYTAIVRGKSGGSGIALLEVYDCGNVETPGS